MKKTKHSQTKESFNQKWQNNQDLLVANTLDENSEFFKWIINRNGFISSKELLSFLKNKKRILDAGCGNGRITAMLHKYSPSNAEIVAFDIIESEIAKKNFGHLSRTNFLLMDLMSDLRKLGYFDFIYCQEVLHHVENPKVAFENLVKILSKNGDIAIYVYKIKGPIREFSDEYIRKKVSDLKYDEASQALTEITKLGKILTELNVKLKVPDIKLLDIKKGEYDLQRFIYHFFLKCFWNDDFSFKDNNAVNYDWYHPKLSFKFEIEEVKSWFDLNDLKIVHCFEDFYGITIRGKKK